MTRLLLVLPLLLANVGCHVGANALPKIKYEQLGAGNNHPSIAFDIRCTKLKQAEEITTRDRLPLPEFYQKRVEKVLVKSKMFSSVTKGSATADYRFHLRFAAMPDRDKELTGGEFAYAAVCGVSFCLIPLITSEPIDLYVDVEKDGIVVKQYRYREKLDCFAWTLFGLIGAVIAQRPVYNECVDNMIRNFLYDLKKERLLEMPQSSGKTAVGP